MRDPLAFMGQLAGRTGRGKYTYWTHYGRADYPKSVAMGAYAAVLAALPAQYRGTVPTWEAADHRGGAVYQHRRPNDDQGLCST